MELKWLLDFVSLSNSGSFSKAAKERNVTQSAFSRRIRSLEEWFGAELINRSNHPVVLTEQGGQLLETAQRIIKMSYNIRDNLSTENNSGNILDFTVASDLPAHFLPVWLRQMEPSIGRIKARINSDSNGYQAAMDCLTQQKCDFLLSYEDTFSGHQGFDSSSVDVLTVSEDILIPVCAKELQTAQNIRLPGSPELSLPYISYLPTSFTGKALAETLNSSAEQLFLEKRYESPCAEHIKNMVRQGFGVAWLNRLSIENELRSGQLTCIGDSQYHVPLNIHIYRSYSNSKPEVIRTWEILSGLYSPRSRLNLNPHY